MPQGNRKSRSLRRVQVTTPTGRSVVNYYRRSPGKAQCANCGEYLKGVARATSSRLRSISKTKKRPERPFGGVLCSRCSRQVIVNKFRNIFSLSNK